ncbi:phenylalanine--tRNA ligase subunit beta [Rothia sp. ZJ1223]|uniref:phenylalanine--tRNA ligase subunit beta n=1 Tax=Rothia sp. ZJ1223 TaxID=2811098 RepID=UPI0019591334|nr:phenylalanine--tRNA ligase subunit beta [Rothia sp. ZJ1223]MBM7051259.1 phenylalanine--tRNA ligase subunit beta [Rothia sp. ZJ1223]
MRIPLSWLREYAPVPADATAEDVMADLVKVGLEEEDVHRPTDELSGPIVVGQVLSMEPETHSNGKTVNWCQVRVVPEGQTQTLTGKGIEDSGVQGIICGAHNFVPGDKVVVTLPGAVLPGGFAITARKTYGHKSAGMIASVKELGIGDDHGGILVLSTLGLDPEVGTDAMELLGLYDQAAEVNVTPDRGYGFSIRGIAREYCHATGNTFDDFVLELAAKAPAANVAGFPVAVEDAAPIHGKPGCTRFVTRKVTGFDASAPVPTWMSSRLRLAGVRSISLAVDISNYVMLETGQPLHFYDAEKLSGSITVRRASAGETLTTLDEKKRQLHAEDLLITDESGPIGLAGVMGGASTEVSESTTSILVESARFDEVSVARTARRHKLTSEASKRFERGVDPQIQAAAAQRAVELLVELGGAQIEEGVTDYGDTFEPTVVELPNAYTASRVGINFTPEQITGALTEIGAQVETGTSSYTVTVPSWRPDITDKEDLTEEVARLVGYDQIPSTLPVAPPGRGYSLEQTVRRRVLNALAAAGGTEVFAYPFVSADDNNRWASASAAETVDSIKLANPIAENTGWLRRSLLPGLTTVLKRNVSRGFRNLAIFETGHVFIPKSQMGADTIPGLGEKPSDDVLTSINEGLPHQPRFIAGVFAGADAEATPGVTPRAYDWQDAVDAVRLISAVAGVEIVISQGAHQAFHPGRTAALSLADGTHLGYAGELHPKLLASLDMPERSAAYELDFTALVAAKTGVVEATGIFGYPATNQDVALIVDAQIPAADLKATLAEGAGELLEDIRVFDDYRGTGIEEGKKSVAFTLRFRATDRTLTADEATAAREAAVALVTECHGATQRA